MKFKKVVLTALMILISSCSSVERSDVFKDPTKYKASDYESIARNYFSQGDYAKCDYYLSIGQTKFKSSLQLKVLHAELLYALNHHQEAYKEFKNILRQDPKNQVARDYMKKFAVDYAL